MGKKLFIFLIVVGLYKWWSAPETISLPNAKFDIEYIKHCHNPLGLSAPLPLVIALHGNGDYPDNFYEYVFDGLDISACFILPNAPTKYGRGYAWPYDKAELDLQSAALAEFSQILQLKHQSPSKPALLGFSGGGVVAYHSSLFHGDNYSFIMPISGFLTAEQARGSAKNISAPVYAFHGKQDQVVSYSRGETAVKLLQKNQVNVTFWSSNGDHHAIATSDKSRILDQLSLLVKTLP